MLWIRIGFNADPDLDPGFWWQKIIKINSWTCFTKYFFDQKLLFTYPGSLSLHKGRPSYRRSLHPQKRTSSTSKLESSSLLWVHFGPPESNTDPDPADQIECGSGSTTLTLTALPYHPFTGITIHFNKEEIGSLTELSTQEFYGYSAETLSMKNEGELFI